MKSIAFAAALTALAVSAQAAPAWSVDKATSSIRFTSSFSGAAFSGGFSRWNADIRFDPAHLGTSSVSVTIDMASAVTGDADRDQALPTSAFFSAGRYPHATFAAHTFKALGEGRYQAIGVLTIRGVSKPLVLPFTLAVTGPRAHMTAAVALDRLAFGVGQDQWRRTDVIPASVGLSIVVNAQKR